MYTEENKKERFSLRDVLLKIMVVMVFILLVIFLVAKIMAPKEENKTNEGANYSEVFNNNLEKMEKSAKDYYKNDKLPSKEGSSNTLTLRQMINLNLLEAFTDSNGKACDVNASYVTVTNNTDHYALKVNLKCPNKEDYKVVKIEKEKQEEVVENNTTTNNNSSSNETNSNNNAVIDNSNSTNNSNGTTTNPEPERKTEYEYKKVVPAVLSNWSSWTSWELNNERYEAIKCDINDENCLTEIQLFSREEEVGNDNGTPLYATVTYYSYRTRTVITSSYTDIKWSYYSDTTLLQDGYTYTGNKR